MPEFKTVHAQAILFTPGLNFRSNRFLGYFLGEHGETFDGEPVSYDPPDGVPMGMPRAMVQDGAGLLTLHGSRIGLELTRNLGDTSSVDVKTHLDLAARLFNGYLESVSAGPGHVGCTVLRARPDENPARTISRHFCRDEWLDGPINRPSGFELSAVKIYSLGGSLPVSSSVRCSSGGIWGGAEEPEDTQPAVMVDQEITTQGPGIDSEQANLFFRLAPEELEEILRLYFPPAEGQRS